MKIYFLSFLLLITCFVIAYSAVQAPSFYNPYPAVCDFVHQKIYRTDSEIDHWRKMCVERRQLVTARSPKKLIIQDISNVLQLLKLSHLEIFDAPASQSIWRGVAKETGIDSEFVDGELVVFKVQPGSSAEAQGLRFGDIVVSINGENPSPWRVKDTAGELVYKRANREMKVNIEISELKRAEAVTVRKVREGIFIIQVPSFRRDFFEENPLLKHGKELKNAKKIIVDLRGNQGGNFVAGLRFLSDFICDGQEVGRLIKPRMTNQKTAPMPNDLNDSVQLAALDHIHSLELKTLSSPLCLSASLKVLVDSKTSSVAEMVAQAFKELRQAAVFGSASAGQLLVGVWYPLDELGEGVQISIPEALYESQGGRHIEGRGVELDKVLYYRLEEMQKGEDSWLKAALKE